MPLKRVIVAFILLPILYLYLMKLPAAYFFGLLLAISVIAQAEFYAMYRISGLMRLAGMFFGCLILAAIFGFKGLLPDLLIISFMAIATLRLIGKKDPAASLHDIAPVILTLLYIPVALGFQLKLRENGPEWILFLYGCVWASDSLAYFIGKTIGKRKLYAEVSPNKTIAGAFGSLLGGVMAGCLLSMIFIPSMPLWKSGLAGISIGATTIIGDLVESMFKRDAGIKDSGTIIPGHGGILDKIDGVLFAGPVFYWLARSLALLA